MQPQATPPAPPAQANTDPSQFGNYSEWAQQEMAKGFTPDQLHQTLQSSGVNSAPSGGGNWLSHLLPTIGSVAPAIGALLAPETGGLSLLAAAGLSGAGAAAGKASENAIEGKNPLQKDDLTAGIEGAAGGAAGGIAGKALGAGADFLGNRATNMVTDAATNDATSAASQDAIDTATATKNNFGGVKPGVQASNNLGGNQELLKGWGVDATDPQAMNAAAKGGLFINNVDNESLALGKPIKTTDLLSSNDIMQSTPEEQQALANSGIITKQGAMPQTVTPAQANAFAQDLNNQVRDMQQVMNNAKAAGNATDYASAKQQFNSLNQLYKNVQNVAATPEVNAAVAARTITPAEKSQLVDQFGQAEADHIEGAVNDAQTHQDLVKAKLPFAQMNDVSGSALQDLKATGTPRAVARVKGDVTDTTPAGTPQPTLLDAAPHVLGSGGILNTAVKGAVHASQNPAILNTMSRIGGLASKLAPPVGSAIATSPNLAADPTAQPGAGGTMGGAMNNTNGMTAGGTVDPNTLSGILAQYMHMGTVDPYLLSSTSPVVQALAPQVQKQQLLGSELNTLPSSYANAGGAQGMGGILSHLTGMIPGTSANTYEGQAAAVAQQLSATLGISPAAAMSLVPKLMQNGQSAGLTQGILGSMQTQLAPNGV